MRSRELITENKLGNYIQVSKNMPDADFWIIRRGTPDKVGKPVKEYNPEHFGIRVTSDGLLPDYLFYALENVWQKGYYEPTGTTNLVGIRSSDIKDIKIG